MTIAIVIFLKTAILKEIRYRVKKKRLLNISRHSTSQTLLSVHWVATFLQKQFQLKPPAFITAATAQLLIITYE